MAQARSAAAIPAPPSRLALPVERAWDGAAPARAELRAWVGLAASADALHVEAWMPHQRPPRVPAAPPGARVERLWEHDVVECFFAARDGRYLELELGAGGHWLALAFDAPRRLADAMPELRLDVAWERDAKGWRARCALPRALVPQPVARANAFAIGGGAFLAHAPVGGAHPDFHRPDAFPCVAVPAWEGGARAQRSRPGEGQA